MRQTKFFALAAAAALILVGLGGWARSTTQSRTTNTAAPISVQIDPFQAMVNANGLPTAHSHDFSVVFN